MPSNAAMHDPNLAIGFNNLASLFAPPSAADAANYADAALKKQKLGEIAQLFQDAASPGFNKDVFDRQNMVAGNWNPSQSYYGVDQGNITDLAKNAADNARALQTNAADNQTKLALPRFSPISQGDIIPAAPSTLASQFGLPEMPQVNGAPKPLSETEWQASQDQRLLANGGITDQTLIDAINGKDTPVKAVGPDGQPIFMTPGAATRTGATVAYPPQQGGQTITTNPDGTVTVSSGKAPTESQSKDIYFLNNGLGVQPILDKSDAVLADVFKGAATGNTAVIGNFLKTPEYRQAEQAGKTFLAAVLRKESGAVINDDEYKTYGTIYLPIPGDDPATIQQKREARSRALQGLAAGLPTAQIVKMEQDGLIPPGGARSPADTPGAAPAAPAPASSTAPPPAGWDPEDWKYLTPEEQAQVNGG